MGWQSLQVGDNTYSVDDVRRYWESAVKAKPDSPLYANALGFAYYAEGDLNKAIDSWFKALNVSLKERNGSVSPTPVATETPLPKEAIIAYAGLALGLYKNAHNQQDDKRERYINEAIKLRQMVVKQDPESFAPDKLAKNWLWTKRQLKIGEICSNKKLRATLDNYKLKSEKCRKFRKMCYIIVTYLCYRKEMKVSLRL